MYFKAINLFALAALTVVPVLADTQVPNADQILRQMSDRLAASKSFSFQATREIDAALLQGRDIAEKATVFAAVQRPNKLAARSVSKGDVRRFIADGKTLTLFDENRNHYAVVPMRTTLDGLVEQVDKQYGFTPPLAEFALSNPYQDFRRQSKTITYLGRGKTNEGFLGMFGVECHRLWLAGKVADAELWIGVGDLLPRKMTATFHREGNPQVRVAFSNWNLAATTQASEFIFTPPKGAQKIEMWTTAKMQSAGKR
jgi:hypothetical protein